MKSLNHLLKPLDRQGFSLVEIMIVVAVLAILGAIAIPAYRGYISLSKHKSAEEVLEQIPLLLENYRAEKGSMCPACTASGVYTYSYSVDNSGVETSLPAANRITTVYPDFKPKATTSTNASLYDYKVVITVAGCPLCVETAVSTATPQTSRGAPPGDITSNPYN